MYIVTLAGTPSQVLRDRYPHAMLTPFSPHFKSWHVFTHSY